MEHIPAVIRCAYHVDRIPVRRILPIRCGLDLNLWHRTLRRSYQKYPFSPVRLPPAHRYRIVHDDCVLMGWQPFQNFCLKKMPHGIAHADFRFPLSFRHFFRSIYFSALLKSFPMEFMSNFACSSQSLCIICFHIYFWSPSHSIKPCKTQNYKSPPAICLLSFVC